MNCRICVPLVMGMVLLACGSNNEYHMPFSEANPTLPSSIQIGDSSNGFHQTSTDDSAAMGTGTPFLWAHLVTWHRRQSGADSWSRAATHPVFAPEGYDSLDASAISSLNGIMASAGIEPLASYWGPESMAGDGFLNAYLAEPSSVQVGVLFEVGDCVAGEGLLRFDSKCQVPFDNSTLGQENARLFREHIAHLHAKYFTNPEYADRFLRVNERPVIFIWLTSSFRGDFATVARSVKAEFPVYLVGSNVNLYNPPRGSALVSIIGGLDAVSAYGITNLDFAPTGQLDAAFVARYRSALQSWSQWLHRWMPDATLIVPLLFAYDDTNIPGRTGVPVESTPEQARLLVRTAHAFIAGAQEGCGNVAPGALVVSLNEDYEGSSVYPTLEHGTAYLDALREFSERPLPERNCP